jgi:TonB family protein
MEDAKVLKYDQSGDGKVDNWQHSLDDVVRQCHHDDDGDGEVDRIEYFDSRGRWQSEKLLPEIDRNKSESEKVKDLIDVEKPPKVIEQEEPLFPIRAKEDKEKGKVVVRVIINEKGLVEPRIRVIDTNGSKADKYFIHVTVNTVRKWTFEPALNNNKPTACWMNITVNFKLEK